MRYGERGGGNFFGFRESPRLLTGLLEDEGLLIRVYKAFTSPCLALLSY